MPIRLVMMFLIIIISTGALAYDLEGTILDYDGEPLADARVVLITAQRIEVGRTYTNQNGFYRIRDIPAGTYTMEISKVGMRTATQDISVGGRFYRSTVYRDINLSEIPRFESVKSSELKALFLPEDQTIPVNAFSNFRRGVRRFERERYRTALRSFKRAISQYPDFSRSYTYIGRIHVINNDYEEAEKYFLNAIVLNPLDPIPLKAFGKMLISQSRYETALRYLEKAVKLDSRRAENYFLLGTAQFYCGDKESAKSNILQGLMMQPRQAGKTRILLADIYEEQKRYTEAREMLSAYIRDNPFSADRSDIQQRIETLNEKIMQIETVSNND